MKLRLISFLTACMAAMAVLAYQPSYYATTSRLNSGHWVKIATDSEGIYQFTYDQLRQMGFDDPSRVQVYGYGALKFCDNLFTQSAPDDLQPTATLHTADGRILFYGQGAASASSVSTVGYDANLFTYTTNYYDTRSYYFLSDAAGTSAIPLKSVPAASSTDPFTSHIHLDFEVFQEQNPINGGVGYHGQSVSPGTSLPYKFRVRNFRTSKAYDRASFIYYIAMASGEAVQCRVTGNEYIDSVSSTNLSAWALGASEYSYYNETRGILTFRESEQSPLTDRELSFTVTVPDKSVIRYAAPQRVVLRYPRANMLDDIDPALVILLGRDETTRMGNRYTFSNVAADGELMVWNIDNPSAIAAYPVQFNPEDSTGTFILSENNARRAIAFNPTATFPAADVIGEVGRQNLHGSATPDMLIITTPEFKDAADRLAAIHRRYQGLDVNVVDHNLIFNEFSSGTRDAMAYRRLAKMYYDRRPAKFKYIIFLGPCNYDNRCLEVTQADRLLTYQNTNATQTRNIITNYTSDNYFGMLDGAYNHDNIHLQSMQAAVGRIPAITLSQANAYINKVERFFTGDHSWLNYGRVIAVAGEGDRNTHTDHSVEVVDSMLAHNPDLTIVPIALQCYHLSAPSSNTDPRDLMINELRAGAGYLTYSGHGDPNFIGTYHQWDRSYAAEVDYDIMPFTMFSSCDQFAFDRQDNGLIETMLFAENGGILGGVGACRSVYITHNQLSCVSTAAAYAMAQPGDTYGDLYLRAHNIVLERYKNGALVNAMINNMNYNLAGDPAIPLVAPSFSAVFSSIDGKTPADGSIISVDPLKPFTVKGYITAADGSKASDFNGKAIVRLITPPTGHDTHNTFNESNYVPRTINYEYEVVAQVDVDVVAGDFSAVMASPAPGVVGVNRLVISAVNSADGEVALGTARAMAVADYDPALHGGDNGSDSPAIQQFYVGDSDFADGDEIPSSTTVTAIIYPSQSGLAYNRAGIASRTMLTLDNVSKTLELDRYITRIDDDLMRLSMPLEGLGDGPHTLELLVANNVGDVVRSAIEFVVVNRPEPIAIDVTAPDYDNQFATIDVDGMGSANRLLISDIHGATVFSSENVSFPFRWQLNDNDGHPVADGMYRINVLRRDDRSYSHSYSAEVVVVR